MPWIVMRTDAFRDALRKHKNERQLFRELDKKIQPLKLHPRAVGEALSGSLPGKRSTRIMRNYRLIFSANEAT